MADKRYREARRQLETAGYVFEGTDGKGHKVFRHPVRGDRIRTASSPSDTNYLKALSQEIRRAERGHYAKT